MNGKFKKRKKKIDLIDFDNAVNFSNEPETCHKSNGAGH